MFFCIPTQKNTLKAKKKDLVLFPSQLGCCFFLKSILCLIFFLWEGAFIFFLLLLLLLPLLFPGLWGFTNLKYFSKRKNNNKKRRNEWDRLSAFFVIVVVFVVFFLGISWFFFCERLRSSQ